MTGSTPSPSYPLPWLPRGHKSSAGITAVLSTFAYVEYLEYGNPHTSAASSTLLLTLGAKTMPLQVYYYLYQGNWFDTAVAATLMTVPVLVLSAFLQRYLRETSLAGVMR